MKKVFDKFLLGANYWPRHQGVHMWKEWDPEAIDKEFAEIEALELNVVRIFLLWEDFQPAENVIDASAVTKFDQLIGIAKRHNLQVAPTFFTGHMSGQNWDTSWRKERDLYTDSTMLQVQNNLLGFFSQRYKDEKQILFWDLANEPDIFSRPPSSQAAAQWSELLCNKLKKNDPNHPTTLGIHFGSLAGDNGFRPQDLARSNDFLSMHAYPIYTPLCPDSPDSIRSTYLAPFASKLTASLSGKTVLFEEFGVSSQLMSEEFQRRYYESVLFSLLANQAIGAIAWCFSDFSQTSRSPYNETPYEVGFGITTADGKLKASAGVMQRFARMLAELDFSKLVAEPAPAAIVIPERYYDNLDEEITAEVNARILFNAFILAKQAGLDVDFISPEGSLGKYKILILPSVPRRGAVSIKGWQKIQDFVKEGGTIFCSYNGVAFPKLEKLFGIKIAFFVPEESDEVFFIPTRELSFQEEISFKVREGRKLVVEEGATLMRDDKGNPVLSCNTYGKGNTFFCTHPIELYLSHIPNVHSYSHAYRIYQLVIEAANIVQDFKVDNPAIESKVFHYERNRILLLINHQGKGVEATVSFGQDKIISVKEIGVKGDFQVAENEMKLSFLPNQSRVFQLVKQVS